MFDCCTWFLVRIIDIHIIEIKIYKHEAHTKTDFTWTNMLTFIYAYQYLLHNGQ